MPEKTISLHIRVPEGIAKEIKELAKKTNTPQGTVLKYLIEQARNEQLETRVMELEKTVTTDMKRTRKFVLIAMGNVVREATKKIVRDIRKKGEMDKVDHEILESVKQVLEVFKEEELDRAENECCYELVCNILKEGVGEPLSRPSEKVPRGSREGV